MHRSPYRRRFANYHTRTFVARVLRLRVLLPLQPHLSHTVLDLPHTLLGLVRPFPLRVVLTQVCRKLWPRGDTVAKLLVPVPGELIKINCSRSSGRKPSRDLSCNSSVFIGKTVAMYFGQPVANLREFLPDEAIPPDQDGGRRGASSSGAQVPPP